MKTQRTLLLALALTASMACEPARRAMEGHQRAVASVDGYTLTIERAAQLLAAGPPDVIPARTSAVDRLVDFWISYTILANELASADTFSDVDLRPLLRSTMDQEVVWQLRENVILTRAAPAEQRLREAYERQQPFTRVKARQILIPVPDDASPAQVDSLERLARDLRDRAVAGEDFAELARRYSGDPATAQDGGDLGWVSRGRLLPELEPVVLPMRPGEVSETVRSNLGYHIFKVTEREAPEFEEVREDFGGAMMEQEIANLERAYIDSLFRAADVEIVPGAEALTRQLAVMPGLERLGPARRTATLAHYEGGELTVGEWADFVIKGSPNARQAFAGSDSATINQLLRELVRNELLTKAAHDEGFYLTEAKADSLMSGAIRELLAVASVSRIRRDELLSGGEERRAEAVQREVDRVLRELFTRQRSPQPIDRVSTTLKRGHVIQIHPGRYPAVVERVLELRAGGEGAPGEATGGESEA